MDLNNKKVAKNIIKLALCIKHANRNDLMLLGAMLYLKMDNDSNSQDFYDNQDKLVAQIRDNPHICALLGIKDKD